MDSSTVKYSLLLPVYFSSTSCTEGVPWSPAEAGGHKRDRQADNGEVFLMCQSFHAGDIKTVGNSSFLKLLVKNSI